MIKKTEALHANSGFTLIETVMVVTIVGIIATSILLYFAAFGSSSLPGLQLQGVSLAGEKLEKVLADRRANGFNSIVPEAPAALAAPFNRFTREVQVFCVQEADLNTSSGTMPNCTDSDIRAKMIKVIVAWSGGSADATTVIVNR